MTPRPPSPLLQFHAMCNTTETLAYSHIYPHVESHEPSTRTANPCHALVRRLVVGPAPWRACTRRFTLSTNG